MSDWRTSQAGYLPEDDLPEIDWGEAAFTPGGGDEPEPEPMPDPGEEERAMARLRARIAERDAAAHGSMGTRAGGPDGSANLSSSAGVACTSTRAPRWPHHGRGRPIHGHARDAAADTGRPP